ncbi:MAG: hypothetical protein LBU15_03200, partial [Rickettsiales bacterium]|nr:hypothetical protein [Rickettsiales bacterium]
MIGNNSRKNDQKNILRKNFTLDMVSSRNQSETARGEMPGHSKFTLVYGRLGVANRIQLGPYSKRT